MANSDPRVALNEAFSHEIAQCWLAHTVHDITIRLRRAVETTPTASSHTLRDDGDIHVYYWQHQAIPSTTQSNVEGCGPSRDTSAGIIPALLRRIHVLDDERWVIPKVTELYGEDQLVAAMSESSEVHLPRCVRVIYAPNGTNNDWNNVRRSMTTVKNGASAWRCLHFKDGVWQSDDDDDVDHSTEHQDNGIHGAAGTDGSVVHVACIWLAGSPLDGGLAQASVLYALAQPSSSSTTTSLTHGYLKSALQPWQQLREQTGWRLARELLLPMRHDSASTSISSSSSSSSSTSFLTSGNMHQFPFQLQLMVLRWTYCHPLVLSLVTKSFARKLALIPQDRVRHEVLELLRAHAQLWCIMTTTRLTSVQVTDSDNVRSPLTQEVEALVSHYRDHRHTVASTASPPPLPPPDKLDGKATTNDPTQLDRLSRCALWDVQKAFYREFGIRAWSSHLIPFGVSSSSFLAMQYARLAISFFKETVRASTPSSDRHRPNCVVWEAASGSCKFLHAFLQHFYALTELEQLEQHYGIIPCVVASDLSDQVLASRRDMPCFQHFLADGRLAFARFDTDIFLHGNEVEKGCLHISPSPLTSPPYARDSTARWRVGHEIGPVFLIGNYFADSLKTDIYVVTETSRNEDDTDPSISRDFVVREALLARNTSQIPDMAFTLRDVIRDPRELALYEDPRLNAALVDTLDGIKRSWQSDLEQGNTDDKTHASLVLFPVEAMQLLAAILDDVSHVYSMAVVLGDATFNALDAIPSAFLTVSRSHDDALEIPQLSPHPDCFCLPVDLEILCTFVLQFPRACAATVATLASDTFNLFYAVTTSTPKCMDVNQLPVVDLCFQFRQLFQHFTPSDCDLLWGLMSLDDGARQLSFDSHVALLQQTAWDHDLFLVLQWPLHRHWKLCMARYQAQQQLETTTTNSAVSSDAMHVLRTTRRQLIEVGLRCFQTFYTLEHNTKSSDDERSITSLQRARWFYELKAYTIVHQLLQSDRGWQRRGPCRSAACYLLGLSCFYLQTYGAALYWFRQCNLLRPKRQRHLRWIARTLRRLQEEQSHAQNAEAELINNAVVSPVSDAYASMRLT